jgi:hypothetical protein
VSTATRTSTRSRLVAGLAAVLLLAGLAPAATLAVAPTTAPTLLGPADGVTVSANPTLSWSTVSGAVKYRVQISTVDTFATFVYNVDSYNTKATPPADLPLGLLYWRVAGTDGSSGVGPFSATAEFFKEWGAAPTLTAPADGAALDFPTQPVLFGWNPLAGAKSYTLEIDDQSDFIGATSYTTNNTSYTLTDPQTIGQQFFWRLRATSSTGGVVSQWSETRSYTFTWSAVPILRSPANDTSLEVQDHEFIWDPVVGAKYYDLQISPNGDWANNLTFQGLNLRGTRYSPPTTLGNGSYFWRVRAKDALLNNGAWSEEWQFTRGWSDRPTLLAPAWAPGDPATVLNVPTFSWTPVRHASHYEIEFSHSSTFSPGDSSTESCLTNHTTFTPYTPITVSGTPGACATSTIKDVGLVTYWHVRGIDGPAGVDGLWSNTSTADTFRFVRDPGDVSLVAPADGSAVEVPSLSWQPVDNVERYRVTILKSDGTTATGGTPLFTYATSYTPDTLDPADGPFFWFVQAVDANGVTSAVPAIPNWFTFSLDPLTTSATLTLTAPADGSTSVRMPAMAWTALTGAAYYKVRYGADGFLQPTPLNGTSELAFPAFTYPGLTLTSATYFWYVEAYDLNDALLDTSALQTFTIEDTGMAGLGDYLAPAKCTPLLVCEAVRDTPTLEWSSLPGAGWYEVTIANDAEFTNVTRRYGTAYTRLTPRESLLDNQAGQAFYWFVRPCVDILRSRCGPGSSDSTANDNASAFQKRSEPIEALGPFGRPIVADQVTFTWRDYLATNGVSTVPNDQEAKQYKIEVSLTADFAVIFDTATVDQTTYTAGSKTYPEGPLYWRIWAIDNSTNNLTKSTPRLVTKTSAAVTLQFPANGATVTGVPWLQWTPRVRAATYTVEVYKNGDTLFSPANKVLTATTKFGAWAPTTPLARGDYTWRVRANDADNRALPWSVGRLFRLLPTAPTLTGPADGHVYTSNNLLFTWSAVPGAVQYKWEASTTCAFSTVYSNQSTVMTAWAPTTQIADGSYCWRVNVLDAAGNTIATSSTRTFSKDATRPTVLTKAPTASASITGPFTVTFSEPVKSLSTTTFSMVIAGTATTVAGTVSPSSSTATTTATFTPSSPLMPGQSYTLSLTSGIVDLSGNPLVPNGWTVRTSLTVEEVSPALVEVWDRDTNAAASGGGYSASRTAGAKASFTFSGTNVTVLGRKSTDAGQAAVYLDGVRQVPDIDLYSPATQWKVPIFAKTGLVNGPHTVAIVALATKQAASSDTWVYVDAFTVGSTTSEETNTAVKFQFRRISNASAFGGSYDTTNHTSAGDTDDQPYYRVTFRGTDVLVYATKTASSGKADFYVDGALVGNDVDLYAAATTYKVKVFDSALLADGIHVLTVKLTGLKQAASTGMDVSLDQVVLK